MNKRIYRVALGLLIVLILLPAPSAPANAAPTFPDIPDGASYADAVRGLTARGVLRGYPDGRFGPADPLLRAQTAATLVRALGLANDLPDRNFSDQGATDAELWSAVRILAGRGIARGYADGTFGPADPLTRQQAISFIARGLVALGRWQLQASAASFSDIAPAHQADIATYLHYVGAIPGAPTPGTVSAVALNAESLAVRGWYAETLWAALRQLESSPMALPPIASPSASPQLSSSVAPTPIPSPTASKPSSTLIALGVSTPGAPWEPGAIARYASLVGGTPAIVNWYQDWGYGTIGENFAEVRDQGGMPMVTWQAQTGPDPDRTHTLAAIARGDHDDYLRTWARAAKAEQRPFLLRPFHEMNGDWYSWGFANNHNGNTPALAVVAWRHVHDIFIAEGATNVLWVWCPNRTYPEWTPYSAFYPGDAYVDWVCIDTYNFGNPDESFVDMLDYSYQQITAITSKPLMLGEIGARENGGTKAVWFTKGFLIDLPARYPRLRAIVYFNEADFRVDSSSASLAAYRSIVAAPLFQGTLR